MENNHTSASQKSTIVLAGATGDLGGRIARSLLEKGAEVRVLVRHDKYKAKAAANYDCRFCISLFRRCWCFHQQQNAIAFPFLYFDKA